MKQKAAFDRPQQSTEAEESSGALHRFLEHSATIIFPFLFILPLLLSYDRLADSGLGWMVIPGAILGLIFGDFITGLVHWAADTYCEESTPVIGRSLVKPFRIHHVRPKEICEHGIVETIGNTCILATPLLALALVLLITSEVASVSAFALFTGVVTVGVTVATNLFHKWAHMDQPSRPIRALQQVRIILPPDHHQVHHTEPFQSSYSITNGWLNPLLNKIHFFRRLEGVLRRCGIRPSAEK